MFQNFKVLLSLTTLIALSSSTFNYCSLCNNHVACNNKGRFSRSCSNPKSIKLTQENIQSALHAHNYLRNKIAGGFEPKFSAAAKMPVLRWDPELAYFAELNVRQCNFKHDVCIKSVRENYIPGQNLFMLSARTNDINGILKIAVQNWYNEVKYVNPRSMTGGGHFTQVVRDQAVAIGCAVAQSDHGTFVTCNYSFGNVGGLGPVYRIGSTGSSCTKGRDLLYKNLCKS